MVARPNHPPVSPNPGTLPHTITMSSHGSGSNIMMDGSPKQHYSRHYSLRGLLRPNSPVRRWAPVVIGVIVAFIFINYLFGAPPGETIDGPEGPDLNGDWEGEWLEPEDDGTATDTNGGHAEQYTLLVSANGTETLNIATRDTERISSLLSLGWRFPPSPQQYNEDRYIDRLRRVRAGTPSQVEEWKKQKEIKLREWIDSRGTPNSKNECRKPPIGDATYYLTVCAVFKNEGSYIEEWLDYHLCAGVEHFYLFDHRSTDNSVDIVEPYVKAGLAELASVDTTRNPQMALYTRCIRNYKQETTWMAFIDTDEFLVPIEQKCLPRLMEDYERFPGVLVCWVFFGSNGHIFQSPDWILTSHPGHGSQVSKRYKTIAQPAKLKSASRTTPHAMIYETGEMPVNERKVSMLPRQSSIRGRPSADILRLNHYRTKSMQEWVHKADRCHTGKSSEQQCLSRLAHWGEFDQNEIKDTVTVERILPCLRVLHVPMPSLASVGGGSDGDDEGGGAPGVIVTVQNTEMGAFRPPPRPVPTEDEQGGGGAAGGDGDDDDDDDTNGGGGDGAR